MPIKPRQVIREENEELVEHILNDGLDFDEVFKFHDDPLKFENYLDKAYAKLDIIKGHISKQRDPLKYNKVVKAQEIVKDKYYKNFQKLLDNYHAKFKK